MSVKPEYQYYLSPEWVQDNIRSKGPLGELYRVWGDGKQMVKGDVYDYFGESGKTAEELEAEGYRLWLRNIQPKGSFLGEGDTFSELLCRYRIVRKVCSGLWISSKVRMTLLTEPVERTTHIKLFLRLHVKQR